MSRYADITVVTQTRNKPGIENWIAQRRDHGVRLQFEYVQFPRWIYRIKSRFDCLTMPYYAAWQWLVLRRARALHGDKPFDLAHHVTFVTFRVPVFLKKLGIPVVFGPVGGAETAPWNLLAYQFLPSSWLREALRNVVTSLGVFMLKILPPIRRGAGICLAATPRMQQVFRSQRFNTELMPAIGIDCDREQSADHSADGMMRFLYVGRLHPLKGVHLAIEAFARAGIDGSTLTIIGVGPEKNRLKKLAARHYVAEDIKWLGQLPREELAEHYRSHDVLIAPSLYESGGLTVLEAMRQRVPAIVLAVGGHDLSVSEGCGLKIPPGGSADEVVRRLAGAMRHYSENPDLVRQHGERAWKRVCGNYDWDGKSARMWDIYQEVVQATG